MKVLADSLARAGGLVLDAVDSARGGSEGVGTATTRAVIGSSFAVIVLDFILSGIGYLFLQGQGTTP